MAPVVAWILVALLTALAVMFVAAAVESRAHGGNGFLADLRAGLATGRAPRARGLVTEARREHAALADVESSSVDEIFEMHHDQEKAYVDAEEIGHTLLRVKRRAVTGVTHVVRR